MPGRDQLKEISKTRFKEVKVLFRNRLYDGAKYLSGYVIETALKARICKVLDSDYPETGEMRSFLTHKYDILIRLGGLQRALDDKASASVNFKTNWSILTDWSESHRYKTIGSVSRQEVEEIISAMTDRNDGVLTWIKQRW